MKKQLKKKNKQKKQKYVERKLTKQQRKDINAILKDKKMQ